VASLSKEGGKRDDNDECKRDRETMRDVVDSVVLSVTNVYGYY
jgi:hypothetical protein